MHAFDKLGKGTLPLSLAALCASLTSSPRALAQDAAQSAGRSGNAVEEVVVTGSRVRQSSGMLSPTPVTAVTTDELTNFDPGGTVADQLNGLPQFFGNRSAQSTTGAMRAGSGSSYLNMRDLGPNRTLVLFDGSRMVPADMNGYVGIDTFPTALIRSVDVVTGGASAAYGADALGGVTNFVLDREFEGLRIKAGTGVTELGDGDRWNLSIAGGKQVGERLHVIGSVQSKEIDEIVRTADDLPSDFWQRWGYVSNPDWHPGAPAGVPRRITAPWVCSSENSPTGVIWARTGSSSTSSLIPFALNGYTFTRDGTGVRPLVQGDLYAAPNIPGSTKTMAGGEDCLTANEASEFHLGSGVSQQQGFGAIKYDFSDRLSAFAQVLIGRAETTTAPPRSNYNLASQWFATVFRDNAFLPADVAAAMDAAGIDSFQLHKAGAFAGDNNITQGEGKEKFTTLSWSVGVDAVLAGDWNLRASWQSGVSRNKAGLFGQTRVDRMFLGMDAVRDASGNIVCRVQLFNPTPEQLAATDAVQGEQSVTGGPLLSPIGLDEGTISGCVPYNVMGAGNMSDAAVAYAQSPRAELSSVRQDFAEVVADGQVADGWSGPISLAVGLTYRKQWFRQWIESDVYDLGPPLNAPELGIQGIAPGYTGGSASLHLFSSLRNSAGEYDVWEAFGELDVPLWKAAVGEHRLDGSVAYRSSHYDQETVESWKIGLDFQLFSDLRLRGTKSRDVREPSFLELYNNRGGGPGTVNDPLLNGLTYTVTASSNGNPNLRPEIADTITAGIVYQPGWAQGLQLSADWYDVKIRDSIGSLGVQRIVDECVAGDQRLCSAITRDASGLIEFVNNGYVNVNQARVTGVDLEAVYTTQPNLFGSQDESLTLRLLSGYLGERSDTPLDGTPLDVAGQYGTPDLTGSATIIYNVGPYGVQLQQRYIGDTVQDVRLVEGVDVDSDHISSGNYTNLRFGYTHDMASGGTWNVALNVTNLFDRSPPVVIPRSGLQTIPTVGYDALGRRYELSMNMSF